METRISVVIVAYNRQLYTQETVRSLLNQSVTPFEILLIDNGSDPPLRVKGDSPILKLTRFDKESGCAYARNFGINESKGEYVAFVDDDAVPSQHWYEAVQKGTVSGADLMGGPLIPFIRQHRQVGGT